MRNMLLVAAICCLALALTGCSMFGCGSCQPDCGCEPVYASPCCPQPSQGMGYDAGGAAAAPAPAMSCGGGSCGGA